MNDRLKAAFSEVKAGEERKARAMEYVSREIAKAASQELDRELSGGGTRRKVLLGRDKEKDFYEEVPNLRRRRFLGPALTLCGLLLCLGILGRWLFSSAPQPLDPPVPRAGSSSPLPQPPSDLRTYVERYATPEPALSPTPSPTPTPAPASRTSSECEGNGQRNGNAQGNKYGQGNGGGQNTGTGQGAANGHHHDEEHHN